MQDGKDPQELAREYFPDPVEIPIGPELDLHTFSPKEVGDIVDAYIDACLEKKIFRVRLIHGKGRGQLRRTVHSRLEKHEFVSEFKLASEGEGSWGATIAYLNRTQEGDE